MQRRKFVKFGFSYERYSGPININARRDPMKNRALAFLPALPPGKAASAASYLGRAALPGNTGTVIDFQLAQDHQRVETDAQILDYYLYLPSSLTPEQCIQGRKILAWSRQALAFRSGASVKAIEAFESGAGDLLCVTRQALAYALEAEGLLFFPGHAPFKGNGCPGATLDPRQRSDFHLIE